MTIVNDVPVKNMVY